jgi:hypothetical protein
LAAEDDRESAGRDAGSDDVGSADPDVLEERASEHRTDDAAHAACHLL